MIVIVGERQRPLDGGGGRVLGTKEVRRAGTGFLGDPADLPRRVRLRDDFGVEAAAGFTVRLGSVPGCSP